MTYCEAAVWPGGVGSGDDAGDGLRVRAAAAEESCAGAGVGERRGGVCEECSFAERFQRKTFCGDCAGVAGGMDGKSGGGRSGGGRGSAREIRRGDGEIGSCTENCAGDAIIITAKNS
jgi:hypothetical protein